MTYIAHYQPFIDVSIISERNLTYLIGFFIYQNGVLFTKMIYICIVTMTHLNYFTMTNISKNKELIEKIDKARIALNDRVSRRGIYPLLSEMSIKDGLNNGKGYNKMTIQKTLNGSYFSDKTPELLLWVKNKVDYIDKQEEKQISGICDLLAA